MNLLRAVRRERQLWREYPGERRRWLLRLGIAGLGTLRIDAKGQITGGQGPSGVHHSK